MYTQLSEILVYFISQLILRSIIQMSIKWK
jgi:hypothetical protein